MKIKFNKTREINKMLLAAEVVFHENNKYYPQVFLNESLHKL